MMNDRNLFGFRNWSAALAAIAVLLFASGTIHAQGDPMQAPRMIGSIQVDEVTMSPLQIIRGLTLDATPETVFDFISLYQNWPKFLGVLQTVKVTGRGELGSTWTYEMVGGGAFTSKIVSFDEPGRDGSGTFAYAISQENPFGIAGHLAVLDLKAADGGGTVLQYYQIFDHPDLNAVGPAVVSGTEEVLSRVLFEFGGERRSATHGTDEIIIEQRRVVSASAARAWQVLGDQWGDVDKWASAVSHSEVSGGKNGSFLGATRSCEVPGTPGFKETMLTFDEDALTLSYQVLEGTPPFVTRATNTWNINPLSDNRAIVESRIVLAIAPGTPGPASGMVKGQFSQLLDTSADELVHFMETGKPHFRKLSAKRAARSR